MSTNISRTERNQTVMDMLSDHLVTDILSDYTVTDM